MTAVYGLGGRVLGHTRGDVLPGVSGQARSSYDVLLLVDGRPLNVVSAEIVVRRGHEKSRGTVTLVLLYEDAIPILKEWPRTLQLLDARPGEPRHMTRVIELRRDCGWERMRLGGPDALTIEVKVDILGEATLRDCDCDECVVREVMES